MRRPVALLVLTALLLALPPLGGGSAGAAVGRRPVFQCSGCWPAAFTFTADGKHVFYVRRFSGEIWLKNLRTGRNQRWARIGNLATSGEQGLLGIDVHPGYPDPGWVYVYYTHESPFENRISRLRKQDGTIERQHLVSIPAAGNHNGGVIHFGPDGKLYAVTGDAGDPSRSQQISSPSGKVLRINPSGSVPSDNPLGGTYAFSYGHRNSFGFAFDPQTGLLWQSENGPECNDEVNLVRPGRNYGWGVQSSCPNTNNSGPNPAAPKVLWSTVIAPTGVAFCQGCGLGTDVAGALLVGAWNDGRIRRLRLGTNRHGVAHRRVIFDNPSGVLALEVRPADGDVYLSDPNGIYRLVRT